MIFRKYPILSTSVAVTVFSASILLAPTVGLSQGDKKHDNHASHAEQLTSKPTNATRIGDVYPLGTCPISGGKLGEMGDPIIKIYDGREIRFCCKGCVSKFESNLSKSMEKVDAQIAEQQFANYPLDYDIVQPDKKLPVDRSQAVKAVIANRLFLLSSETSIAALQSDPKTYISKLDHAVIENQSASYPMETCVVSAEKFGGEMGEAINYVYNGELVKFCCKGCIKMFEKEPQQFMSKLHDANLDSSKSHGGHMGMMDKDAHMMGDGHESHSDSSKMEEEDHSGHNH